MIDSYYANLLWAWGIEFSNVDESVGIEGSPERTATRSVVCDTSGSRWILEEITPDNLARKKEIAGQLTALSTAGLEQVHPWLLTKDNTFFQCLEKNEPPDAIGFQGLEESHWMLRSYVDGFPLNRETYLEDSWRIDAMVDFLIRLRTHTADWSGPVFSIADYAGSRMTAWRGPYLKLAEKLEGSFSQLAQNFFPVHDSLPVAFCHGDYHPLNMVWGEASIRSVIDWEFCGIKPELYDVALLLGCFGFDEPDNLITKPAIHLVQKLRATGFCAQESWDCILELMATIRFGWMSEWIRRGDADAVEMEALYIDILVDQKDFISNHWKNTAESVS